MQTGSPRAAAGRGRDPSRGQGLPGATRTTPAPSRVTVRRVLLWGVLWGAHRPRSRAVRETGAPAGSAVPEDLGIPSVPEDLGTPSAPEDLGTPWLGGGAHAMLSATTWGQHRARDGCRLLPWIPAAASGSVPCLSGEHQIISLPSPGGGLRAGSGRWACGWGEGLPGPPGPPPFSYGRSKLSELGTVSGWHRESLGCWGVWGARRVCSIVGISRSSGDGGHRGVSSLLGKSWSAPKGPRALENPMATWRFGCLEGVGPHHAALCSRARRQRWPQRPGLRPVHASAR